jgi:hypothetical protein
MPKVRRPPPAGIMRHLLQRFPRGMAAKDTEVFCRIGYNPYYAFTFRFSANFFRNFASLGATTNAQYGCIGLFSR